MKPTLYFLVLGLLASACGDQPEPDLNDNSSGNPATAPVDYLGAVNKGRNRAIINAGLLQVNSAINQFKATSSQNRRPACRNSSLKVSSLNCPPCPTE